VQPLAARRGLLRPSRRVWPLRLEPTKHEELTTCFHQAIQDLNVVDAATALRRRVDNPAREQIGRAAIGSEERCRCENAANALSAIKPGARLAGA
jgi:hypothetical protein